MRMPKVSGTIAAVAPSEVPTMNRVIGISTMSRMRNGSDRLMLT